MINLLLALIYFPLALFWAVFYGVLGGLFYKFLGCIEDWQNAIFQITREWKRYPKMSYEKYLEELVNLKLGQADKGNDFFRYLLTENSLKEHVQDNFPVMQILGITVIYLLLLPFRLLTAVIEGPIFVFSGMIDFWNSYFLKIDTFTIKYLKRIQNEK